MIVRAILEHLIETGIAPGLYELIKNKLLKADALAAAQKELADFQEKVIKGTEIDTNGERLLLRELKVGDAYRAYTNDTI